MTGTKIGPTTLNDQALMTIPRCMHSDNASTQHSNRNLLPYHPSQPHSQTLSIKLEIWIVPSTCSHHNPIHPLLGDTEEVVLPLEFEQLRKKNLLWKSTQHMVVVNFKDVAADPCFDKESSPLKKGNAASERNSACTVANQDTLPPTAT